MSTLTTSLQEGISTFAGSGSTSQFRLQIPELDRDDLSILSFEGDEYALSGEYRFEITFEADGVLPTKDVVGKRGVLTLDEGIGERLVHGVVRQVESLEGSVDRVRHRLTLGSPLIGLDDAARTRSFPDTSLPDLINEVIEGHGWDASAWRLELTGDYEPLPLTVQCGETDLQFIKRLMARHGLYYRFEQSDDQAVLVIHDSLEGLPDAPIDTLDYIPQSGEARAFDAVHRLESRTELLTQAVNLRDYNPETPDVTLDATARNASGVPGTGERHVWGEQLRTPSGADTAARLAAERLACRRHRVVAHTDHRGLAPGMQLSIGGHPDTGLNIRYTVVAMRMRADQNAALPMGGQPTGPTFEAEVELIPATICFRPPLPTAPVIGRVSARIESPGGDYAHLDEHGRYRLRFDFDERDNPQAEASHAVRLSTPFAGDDYGFHFPLLAETEVLTTFENNDPDRPLIAGALHNHAQPSPVNATNPSQNVLRTPGGNELLMDDEQGAERIALTTRDERLSLILDATDEQHIASLRTEDGDMEWYAGKGLTLECGDDQIVSVGGSQEVTVEESQRLLTRQAGISWRAGTDIRLVADQDLRFESVSADIRHVADRDMALETGRNLKVNARSGHFDCRVEQGEARFRAGGEIQFLSADADVRLGNAGAGLSVTNAGDVAIKATNVTIEASNVRIKAGNVSNN